jgi:hypothetical protein
MATNIPGNMAIDSFSAWPFGACVAFVNSNRVATKLADLQGIFLIAVSSKLPARRSPGDDHGTDSE